MNITQDFNKRKGITAAVFTIRAVEKTTILSAKVEKKRHG